MFALDSRRVIIGGMDEQPRLMMLMPLVAFVGFLFVAIAICIAYRIARSKRPPDDAIELVEFVMELEDRFRIAVPDEDYEKIKTVDDAKRYFEERKKRL